MAGNADLGGDIDQARHADGGIDHEAAERVGRLVAVSLQHVIGEYDRRIQIGEGVVNAFARGLRHGAAIEFGDRPRDGMVELDVEIEYGAIGRLPGVVLRDRLGILWWHKRST